MGLDKEILYLLILQWIGNKVSWCCVCERERELIF
jgi:hypothetical protein